MKIGSIPKTKIEYSEYILMLPGKQFNCICINKICRLMNIFELIEKYHKFITLRIAILQYSPNISLFI